MRSEFVEYLSRMAEKHIPVAYLDYELLVKIKRLIATKQYLGRKEVLIMAYMIGTDMAEADELLRLSGHPILYAKNREDAVWKYAFNRHTDSNTLMDMIFPQK